MQSFIASPTHTFERNASHVSSLRARLSTTKSSITTRKQALQSHQTYLAHQANFNAPEIKFWERYLRLRLSLGGADGGGGGADSIIGVVLGGGGGSLRAEGAGVEGAAGDADLLKESFATCAAIDDAGVKSPSGSAGGVGRGGGFDRCRGAAGGGRRLGGLEGRGCGAGGGGGADDGRAEVINEGSVLSER